jgi:uncharacterized protein
MKREVKILGLSYSQTQVGSYVIVLSEINSKRKLPIIIKPADAQHIALKIEGLKSPRPLTHDLFKSLSDSFGIDIQEVYLYSIVEGIFYTKIYASNSVDDIEIECGVGDGIALSLLYECPIYVNDEIFKTSGIYMDDNGSVLSDEEIRKEEEKQNAEKSSLPQKRVISIDDLKQMMKEAVENEEYEIAAEIRERINNLSR